MSEAVYAWDEQDMNTLVSKLKSVYELDEEKIRLFRYFCPRYFAERVQRHCLGPCELYCRVYNVFATFDMKRGPKTNKALFNKLAWKKANGILKEILCRYYSDPPGESLFRYKLRKNGSIRRDNFGITLLRCIRDTNALEGEHKNIKDTFGSRSMGVEFADLLLRERRHRCNIGASQRNLMGYPNIEMYDTWLVVDLLQLRVDEKHKILIYPTWVCAS